MENDVLASQEVEWIGAKQVIASVPCMGPRRLRQVAFGGS